MKTNWDYTELASNYDMRADYAKNIVNFISLEENLTKNSKVAEIGAGTGKLTKLLLNAGYSIDAVEPNDAMRSIGQNNIKSKAVIWSEGTAENTGLDRAAYESIWFGSSLNVTNFDESIIESESICAPAGVLVCMWNHRDLNDRIQQEVETLIKNEIPEFSYGTRRSDPTELLLNSKKFQYVKKLSVKFDEKIQKSQYINAWKSHATLRRNCSNETQFSTIINRIENFLRNLDDLIVPYETNAWMARFDNNAK
jgi:ubiquinone/menaquinone biosynthesis C-methylase UbiE